MKSEIGGKGEIKLMDVICIGAAIVDLPLFPVGEYIFKEVSYPVDDISMTIGGDAINEATIITRLGNRVSLMGMVGNDAPGNFIKEFAQKNNVTIENLVVRDDVKTSINVGLVRDNGDRTFVTNRNGSLWKLSIDDIDLNAIKEAKILSLASIFNNPRLDNNALVKIFEKAKSEDMMICADVVKSRLGENLNDIAQSLSYVDYFFPNYEEAAELTGKNELTDIADTFMNLGVKNVIIKIGKEGCYIQNDTISKIIPAFKIDKGINIDTIGAGDNFVSGFISELLQNKDIETCAYFGNAVAAVSVQSLGATTGVRNRNQVEQMIEEYKKKSRGN